MPDAQFEVFENGKIIEHSTIDTNEDRPAQDQLVNSLRLWGRRIGFAHHLESPLKVVIVENRDTGHRILVRPGEIKSILFERIDKDGKKSRTIRVLHDPEITESL